jgi:hypothetical protein
MKYLLQWKNHVLRREERKLKKKKFLNIKFKMATTYATLWVKIYGSTYTSRGRNKPSMG